MILRDENLDVMDLFLTNGGRSIPKLISVNADNDVLFSWGPRPSIIQEKYMALRNEGLEYADISKQIHTMYAKDKGISVIKEFRELLDVPAFS